MHENYQPLPQKKRISPRSHAKNSFPESRGKGFWPAPSCSLCRDPIQVLAGRRGSEAAVTRSTRNRVTGDELVRGFESHPLRHLENSKTSGKIQKALKPEWIEGFLGVRRSESLSPEKRTLFDALRRILVSRTCCASVFTSHQEEFLKISDTESAEQTPHLLYMSNK